MQMIGVGVDEGSSPVLYHGVASLQHETHSRFRVAWALGVNELRECYKGLAGSRYNSQKVQGLPERMTLVQMIYISHALESSKRGREFR
jgi:hypothetical protein